MNLEQQLKLSAFLDGELPADEAREILAWTQRDHEAAALLAELQHTRQALAESEPPRPVPESREFYWSKIEREIRRQEPRTSAPETSVFDGLRRWFFPAVAVSALVLAGVLAHFYTPPVRGNQVANADTPIVETTLASANATTYRDVGGGTTLVWFTDSSSRTGKPPTAIN